MFLQFKRLFMTNLIFLLLLFMFNIRNIGTNSLEKDNWQQQSNKHVASFDKKRIEILYGISP